MMLFGQHAIRGTDVRFGAVPVEAEGGVVIWFVRLQPEQLSERETNAPASAGRKDIL
jgi:hypothetical protein